MSQDRASAGNSKSENTAVKHRKKPKKITESYLHNAGLYYLERFSSSSGNFHAVMLRKVKRSCIVHTEQNYEQCAAMVDALVEKFINAGLLDDETYTRSKVSTLRRRGKSARFIDAYLKAKGLPAEQIGQALKHYDNENTATPAETEREAAITFARKKRLGPFRDKKEYDPQKELGRMARAGFSYDTSRSVLELE
jgi:regulatory protein